MTLLQREIVSVGGIPRSFPVCLKRKYQQNINSERTNRPIMVLYVKGTLIITQYKTVLQVKKNIYLSIQNIFSVVYRNVPVSAS